MQGKKHMEVQNSCTVVFLYTRGINRSTTIMELVWDMFEILLWFIGVFFLHVYHAKGSFEVVLHKIPNQVHYLAVASLLLRFELLKPLTNF